MGLAGLAIAAAMTFPAPCMAQANRPKSGTLTCDVVAGIGVIVASKKELTCMFTPARSGPREVYLGTIAKFGLDLGVAGEMVWSVYAPAAGRFGALSGHYSEPAIKATAGGGDDEKRLVGGSNGTVTLQPAVLQDQNLAAGVAAFELRPAR
jgi:hypothetical protein